MDDDYKKFSICLGQNLFHKHGFSNHKVHKFKLSSLLWPKSPRFGIGWLCLVLFGVSRFFPLVYAMFERKIIFIQIFSHLPIFFTVYTSIRPNDRLIEIGISQIFTVLLTIIISYPWRLITNPNEIIKTSNNKSLCEFLEIEWQIFCVSHETDICFYVCLSPGESSLLKIFNKDMKVSFYLEVYITFLLAATTRLYFFIHICTKVIFSYFLFRFFFMNFAYKSFREINKN